MDWLPPHHAIENLFCAPCQRNPTYMIVTNHETEK